MIGIKTQNSQGICLYALGLQLGLLSKPKQEVVNQVQIVCMTGHSSKIEKDVFWK